MNTTQTEAAVIPNLITVTREQAAKMRKSELQEMLARERVASWPVLYRHREAEALAYVRRTYPTKRACLILVDAVTRSLTPGA